MRAVVRTAKGILELNYMWLPTWIGMNSMIKAKLERELKAKVEGMEMSDENLDAINEMVLDHLEELNPTVDGLRDYLDGLKFVKFTGDHGPNSS
jgi:hypothetical protein